MQTCTCELCGKPYESGRQSVNRYCPDCRKEANRKMAREWSKKKTRQRAKMRTQGMTSKKPLTLTQIAQTAIDSGMTYGKYVAQLKV